MKKYRFSIQIGLNITDIMLLPCVEKCEKEVKTITHHFGNGEKAERTETNFVYTLFSGQRAHYGDWLMKDVCDHWNVMTDKEYQQHIDDII